jgi:hypothetical protein
MLKEGNPTRRATQGNCDQQIQVRCSLDLTENVISRCTHDEEQEIHGKRHFRIAQRKDETLPRQSTTYNANYWRENQINPHYNNNNLGYVFSLRTDAKKYN